MIHEKAEAVFAHLSPNALVVKQIRGNPGDEEFAILTIVEVILALLQLYQWCGKSAADVALDLHEQGRLMRRRLRKEIERHWSAWTAADITDAFLAVAATCTSAEVAAMYGEMG